MSSQVLIYSDAIDDSKSLYVSTGIDVAQNEPMVNPVFNRNAKTLLENDIQLQELYKRVFDQLHINDWSASVKYNVGDIVWYADSGRLYLLKCILDGNMQEPAIRFDGVNPSDLYLKVSGWENQNKYLTIFDYGIADFLDSLVSTAFDKHQTNEAMHPLGEVSLDLSSDYYIDKVLLKNDTSNVDQSRSTTFFPQTVLKLDSGTVVMNGYMRNYGKVLEYDILLKLASNEVYKDMQVFAASSGLSCNSLKLQLYNGITKNSVSYQENDKYFYNSQTTDIFSPDIDDSHKYTSKIGMIRQNNRNDFVNTYSAKISFPKPFVNRSYMVFSNSIMCQTNGTVDPQTGQAIAIPSQNDIAICDKTRDSITLLNITFPKQGQFDEEGKNAKEGGLIANSFHCKVVGLIGA